MGAKVVPSANYLMLMGIAMLVFGCIAIASPALAGTSVVIVIGVLLVISGLTEVIHGIREASLSSKLLSLVLGVITLMAGLAVLAHPLLGLTVLTLILAIYFVVEGVWKIFASFSFRPAPGWLAVLGSGVIALVLGFLIWRQWPLSGLWAVGVLVGVDLVATGLALLLLASTIRRIKTAA
jgi:membrane protein HdeD